MEKEIKISVIMPVYMVEQYVQKAIESILSQTLKGFELIIVDDGSPDRSGQVCDRYAGADPRIRVIHKENGGAPSARNLALDMARGKYVFFFDSDDWAESTMLEEMYTLAEESQAQLVIAGFYIDTYYADGRYMTIDCFADDKVYATKRAFRKDAYKLFDQNMLYTPWNKLYLLSYIKGEGLYFPNTFWDDFPFNLSVVRDIGRVAVTSKQYYHFLRARAESETAKYVPQMYEKREEEHGWMLGLYRYWGVRDKASQEMVARRYLDRLVGCFENLTNPSCTLTKRGKRGQVERMLANRRVGRCIKYAVPGSFYMKLLYLSIRWGVPEVILWEASIITFVKTKYVKLFTRLKANR